MARYKLIACDVFQRELCAAVAASPNVIDLEFLELGLHVSSDRLRARLQERIDAVSAGSRGTRGGELEGGYDALLLGYGLCGNGLAGIEARALPLALARAHDCCTILLGSRAAFLERFGGSLSASWSSAGYVERGHAELRSAELSSAYFRASEVGHSTGVDLGLDRLVETYGEENARYLWDALHPAALEREIRYIETPETESLGYADRLRAEAAAAGKDFLLLRGSSRLLRALVAGGWDPAEFLVVPPGGRIEPLYDHESVFKAV